MNVFLFGLLLSMTAILNLTKSLLASFELFTPVDLYNAKALIPSKALPVGFAPGSPKLTLFSIFLVP